MTEPWLSVTVSDGTRRKIPPWEIADLDVVDIVQSRADLNGAARELMIGLLQVVYPPEDDEEKIERIKSPPCADEIKHAFESHSHLFELTEGQSRFLQEHCGIQADEHRPIDNLLLNGPGEQTRKLQKDFFVRRDMVSRVCQDCTILMLYAKQAYASGTGPGFRVSPRGGGPLTTVIEFSDDDGNPVSLWQSLYANVLSLETLGCDGLDEENASLILPWLAPLRISKAGKIDVPTTVDHAHPLQVYFPMPARIEMVWEQSEHACPCDICGTQTNQHAIGWKTLQYGVMYSGLDHPLTPYRVGKDNVRFSMKPKQGGVSYQDWMSIVLGAEGKSAPSYNIQSMKNSIHRLGFPARIRAFGYHLDNASALAWHEAVVPFIDVPEHLRKDFAGEVGMIVDAASEIGSALVSHVKQGLYDRPSDTKGDMTHIQQELTANTSKMFYSALPKILDALGDKKQGDKALLEVKIQWLDAIRKQALWLFNKHAPIQIAEERNLQRLVTAYRKFDNLLRSDWARKLLALPMTKKPLQKKPVNA